MTKEDLVKKAAEDASISKADAAKALESILDSIAETLSKGEKISFVGFGTFSVSVRAARQGRNPATKEIISIPETKVPKFTSGKKLKDAV
jgi:DNA-binding protein HU-beta